MKGSLFATRSEFACVDDYLGGAGVEPRVRADGVLDAKDLPGDGGRGLVEGPLGAGGGDAGGHALEAEARPGEDHLGLRVTRDHLDRDLGAGVVPQGLDPALVAPLVPLLHVEDDQGPVIPEVYPVLEPHVDALVILGPLDISDPEIPFDVNTYIKEACSIDLFLSSLSTLQGSLSFWPAWIEIS